MSTWGHWENQKPGPGYGGAYNTGKPENNDPNWAYAWSMGFTWVETVGNAPFTGGVGDLTGTGKPGVVNDGYAAPSYDPNGLLPIVYGRRRVPIQILRQHDYTGDGAPWLWQAIGVIGEGQVSSVARLWCNKTLVQNVGVGGFGWAVYPGSPAGEACAFLSNTRVLFATRDGIKTVYELPEVGMTSVQIYDNLTLLATPADYSIAVGAGPNGRDQITFTSVGTAGHTAKASWVSSLPNTAYLDIQINSGSSLSWKGWSTLVPGGVTTIEFEADVYGRLIFDHRDGGQSFSTPSTWLYSDNPVLAIRDLLANPRWKLNYTINDTSFDAGANVCDVTTDGIKRFTCNDLIAVQADAATHLAQLCLACNASVFMGLDGVEIFVDVENSGAPVMTLDTAKNFLNTKFETLPAKDSPNQIVVTYQNIALDFAEDSFSVPPELDASVVVRQASYSFNSITDVLHATRAAAYILNQNVATPVRVSGTVSQAGIILGVGAKVAVTTSDGPAAAPFLITESQLQQDGSYAVAARQYDSSTYSDSPVDTSVPVPTDLDLSIPPPPAAARWVTSESALVLDLPRVYTVAGPYGAALWSVSGDASHTASKINDRDATAVAITTVAGNLTLVVLDLGVGITKAFGRIDFWTDIGTYAPPLDSVHGIDYSDDGSNWYTALTESSGSITPTTAWNDAPASGIYPQHIEIPSAIGAHRYWRFGFNSASVVHVYEIQASTFADWAGAAVGYELRTWTPYGTADATQPIVSFLPTLPTSGSPFVITTAPLFIETGSGYDGFTETVALVATTRGQFYSSNLAVPFGFSIAIMPSLSSTTDTLAKFTSTAGVIGDSSVTDDGTIVQLSEPLGFTEATLPSLSAAGQTIVAMDSADHALKASVNGGAYAALGGGGTSPLTTKGDLHGFDTADARVPVGADGKVLTADSGAAAGVSYQAPAASPTTTKGDLAGFDTASTRVPVGTDGKILTADSTAALGVKYKAPSELDFGFLIAQSDNTTGVHDITGALNGINGHYTLPKTPSSSRIHLVADTQPIVGGVDYFRTGTAVYFPLAANRPKDSLIALYPWGGPDDGLGTPEGPPTGSAATWTAETGLPRGDWYCVTYGAGLFVAGGQTGSTPAIATSPDGVTWTQQTLPSATNSRVTGIAWNGRFFVAVQDSTSSSTTWKSYDGVTWVAYAPGISYLNGSVGLCYSPKLDLFVAANGVGGTTVSRLLSDGVTWAQVTPSPYRAATSICWADGLGLFVIACNTPGATGNIFTSPDAITWTQQSTPTTNTFLAIAWSSYLGILVAVGAGATHASDSMTSVDGVTWTLGTTPNAPHGWDGICWSDRKGIFIAVGNAVGGGTSEAMTSPDGLAWTPQTSITDSRFAAVADNGTLAVAVANNASGGANDQVMISTA